MNDRGAARPEHIVVIHDFSYPRGGATLLAVLSALEYRRRGYRVTFLTGDAGENADLAGAGVEIVALDDTAARDMGRAAAFLKALYNFRAKAWLSAWIRANDTPATVYHLHNWGQILTPAALHALNRVRDRLVLSAHDFFHVCPNGSFSFLRTGKVCGLKPMSAACITANCDRRNYGYKLWRVARQAIRNLVFDTAAPVPLVVIHERMKPFFARAGVPESALVALPNPVAPFRSERIEAEANDELVFVGRMETTKGPDLAAAAARAGGVKMRFIGGGARLAELQAAYPEMIFHGFTPRAEIAALLGGARALVMPSRYPEPYGLVAVEALWSGLPVILTDTAFLAPDIVAAGAGIGCDPNDRDALVAAIRATFDDDEATRRMSLAAFAGTRPLGNSVAGWVDGMLAILSGRLGDGAADASNSDQTFVARQRSGEAQGYGAAAGARPCRDEE